MKTVGRALLALAVLLASFEVSAQPIPRQLNVQGVLRNAVGEVVSGSYNLTFRLYDAQSGGTKLFEQQASITITGGVFNVYLGPLPQNIFAHHSQVWLEIQVGNDPPLPRRPLTSAGYAFMAEHAAECDVLLSAATDLNCVQCVSEDEVSFPWARGRTPGGAAVDLDCSSNPCVSSTEIVDGQVTSADIGDGEVRSEDLAPNLTLSGNTTVSNLLVTSGLYSGTSISPSTLRLDNQGNLKNIGTITMSGQLTNTVASGTPPFVVSSSTRVVNLNADLLDGQHGSFYQNASNLNAGTVPVERLPVASTTSKGVVQVGNGLAIDTSGVLSNAGLLGLSVVAPLQSTGGQNPILSISQASATSSGYLSQTDWNTFNNKLSSVTTRSGDPFVGSGTPLAPLGMTQAGPSSSGWLSAADWNNFNSKAPGSGSNSYIQNQTASDQNASFRISGTGEIGGGLTVRSSVTASSFVDREGSAYYLNPAEPSTSATFAGNIGVGTTSPQHRIDVVGGNVRTDGQFISTTTTQAPMQVSSSMVVTNLNADLLDGQHASAFAPASGSGNYIQNQTASAQNASFWISGTGQVGGNFTAGALCLAGDCKTAWSQVTGPWTVAGNNIYNNNTGNVGIKNTNPTAPLTVGSIYAPNSILGTLGAYDTRSTNPNPEAYGMGITLEFKGNSANGLNDGGLYNAVLSYRQWSSGTDWTGGGVHQLAFTQNGNLWHRYSQTTGSWGPWRQVAENGMTNPFSFMGKVGVGTTSPITRLQIGDPYSGVASNWPASASQGVLIGQDTDNLFVGLIDEGSNADRAAIVFGDDSDDYLRVLFNNPSAGMTELIRILPDGRTGFGVTSPGHRVDVNGNVNATQLCIQGSCINSWAVAGTNYWTLSGTNLYPSSTVYNVGIGTTAPDQKFVVTGAGSTFKVYGNATGDIYSTGPLRPHFSGSDFNVYSGVPGSGTLRLGIASDGTTLLAPSGGNVGVGSTSAPSQRLHVRGGNAFVDGGVLMLADTQGQTPYNIRSYSNAGSLWFYPNSGSTAQLVLATSHNWDTSLSLRYTPGTVGAGQGLLQIGQLSKNASTFTHGITAFYTNGLERMRIDSAGRVGIGTPSPSSLVHVEGGDVRIGPDQNSGRLYFGSTDNTKSIGVENWWMVFRGHGNEGWRFTDDTGDVIMQINGLGGNNGFVGIGTTSPGAKLEVKAGTENQTGPVTAIKVWGPNQPTNSNSAQDIQFGFSSAGSARIRAYRGGSWDTYLQFLTNDSSAGADNPQVRLHIAGNGNVGINTTSPNYRLHVNGDTSTNNFRLTGSVFTDQMNRIIPFYVRGTGLNNSANRRVVLGNTVLVDNAARGLTLTIIRKSDMAHISSTNYDTYGDSNASNSLATALSNASRDYIYILTSFDAWENAVTSSLKAQFERLGLFKALGTPAGARRPYAAVFEVASSGQRSARVIEVEHSDNANAPYAEIAGWFANGTFMASAQPNALTNSIGTVTAVLADEGGNVGVGTTSPQAKLHVAGDLRVDGQVCTPAGCGSGLNYWALSGSNLYPTSTSYNVGIGVTDAGSDKLRVGGAIRTTAGGAYGSGGLFFGYHSLNSNSNGWLYVGDQNGSVYGGRGLAAGQLWSDGQAILAASSGNVGVGTSSPTHKLQVVGNLAMPASSSYLNIPASYTRGVRNIIMASSQNADGSGWAYGSRISVVDYGDGLGTSFDTLYAGSWLNDALVISGRSGRNGYIGIGTASPSQKLHVANGNIWVDGNWEFGWNWINTDRASIRFESTGDGSGQSKLILETLDNGDEPIEFRQSGNVRMVVSNSGPGYVGIGTTSPSERLDVNGNVRASGSFSSSVAPSSAAVMKVTNGQIAIQQQTSEGNTRIFADFPPYHSWGIYHKNDTNDILFTRRDGSGFFTFSEAGPGGTTTTTVVGEISLDEGNARFYGTVNARAGLCINNDCKASWQDVVQGVTGSHVRGVVQIFGLDEGAARITSTSNYQVITKTLYTPLEGLFNLPAYPGTVREYYIGIRKADNIDSCGGGTDWRFWFTWAGKNGHAFSVGRDWGSVEEGSVVWVQVPPIANQASAAGASPAYWRLEAKIPSSCGGRTMKVYAIYVMAVDRSGGSTPGVSLASGGAGIAAEFDFGGGQNIALDAGTGNVGINVFPESGIKLDVNGMIRSRSGGIKFPDGTVQTTAPVNYWTLSGSNLYPNNTGWNVGIGNTSPQTKLHVTGNVFIDTSGSSAATRNVTIKDGSQGQIAFGSYPGTWTSALQIQNNNNTRFLWLSPLASDSGYNARFRVAGSGLDFYVGGGNDTGTYAMTIASNGRVGIGTTNPGAALEVNGDISLPSSSGNKQIYTWSPTDSNWRIGMSANPGFNRAIATSHVEYLTYANGTGQGFAVGVNGGDSSFEVRGSDHQAYFRGRVGIQHTSPATALHVGGAIAATDWVGAGCEGSCEVSGGYSLLYPNGFGVFTKSVSIGAHSDPGQGNLYVTNRIGIGTNAPGASLDIAGNPTNAIRTAYLNISASNSATSDRPYIRGTDTHLVITGHGTNKSGTLYVNYPGDLASGYTTNTRIQETIFVSATGSGGNGLVGVGQSAPSYKLDVSGDVRATGSVYLTDGNTRLVRGAGNSLRVQTNSGYVDIGPQNTGWAHFITDRGSFYFNPKITVDGNVEPYTDNTRSLGTSSLRWAAVHTNQVCLSGDCRTSWPLGGGSGTTNYVTKWTGTSTLGNSIIYDNGTYVGIGTTSPAGKLDVVGNAYVRTAAGSNNVIVLAGSDANIGLELRSGSSGGTPYIDFANDASSDYDARLRLVGNGQLSFEGTNVGIGRTPGEALDVQGNVRAYGVIYSQSDPSYAQTYLRTWGLAGNGTIYIEPAGGQTLWLTDSWSTTGTLGIQFGRTSWKNASGAETAWVDRDGNASFNGTVTAGNLNISGEIVQVEDSRISYGGSWTAQSNCWGVNRFSTNCRYTPPEGDADASGYTITLSLNNNQYRSVLMSHLDWSNTRFFDVYLSFDGGASYTFHKRIYTYRATTQTPYTSTIYAIAENLPIGANVRVRIQGRRGRIHFEGFALLKYNVGDTEPNREHMIGTIYYDADNLGYYVDPNGTSMVANFYSTTEMRAPIFRDYNDPSNFYVDPNGTSVLHQLSVNDGAGPCCAGYYTVSINEGGGNQPTLQFHDSGVAEGQIILQGDVGAGGGRGFRFQSTQTTMAGRFTGRVISDHSMLAPIYYDSNGSSCQVDPSDWTRVQYLTASYDIIAQRSLRAPQAYLNELAIGWNIVPTCENCGQVGAPNDNRRFWAMFAYSFNQASSERIKGDIRDLSEQEYRWALDQLRKTRTVFFRYKKEIGDAADGTPSRIAPHIGVIAETLPPHLTEWNGEYSGGYNLADMDGLLVAAVKALDSEVKTLREQNRELMDRVSILEQVLVDAGLLK